MGSTDSKEILSENHFISIPKKNRKFLKAYYDEMSVYPAMEITGHKERAAYALIASDIGKKYLSYLKSKERNQGKTTRQDLIKELEKTAFSSLDSFLETWVDDEEDENGELVPKKYARFSTRKIANMTARERNKVMSTISKIKTDRYGGISEITTDKLKAIDILAKLIGAYKEEDNSAAAGNNELRLGYKLDDT